MIFVRLDSVPFLIDGETATIYPANSDGTADTANPFWCPDDGNAIPEEWVAKLSPTDRKALGLIALSVKSELNVKPSIRERLSMENLSNHQGYKRLSIFVPCVVFVMVWINLKIEEGHIDAGDFAWISGLSALFAALSFVAVKGIHWVTDGFKPETKESQERSKGE